MAMTETWPWIHHHDSCFSLVDRGQEAFGLGSSGYDSTRGLKFECFWAKRVEFGLISVLSRAPRRRDASG